MKVKELLVLTKKKVKEHKKLTAIIAAGGAAITYLIYEKGKYIGANAGANCVINNLENWLSCVNEKDPDFQVKITDSMDDFFKNEKEKIES